MESDALFLIDNEAGQILEVNPAASALYGYTRAELLAKRNVDLHRFLTEKAETLKPGESGLLALDWWNGNRSVLVDVDLTGMMLGMTLTTVSYTHLTLPTTYSV